MPRALGTCENLLYAVAAVASSMNVDCCTGFTDTGVEL